MDQISRINVAAAAARKFIADHFDLGEEADARPPTLDQRFHGPLSSEGGLVSSRFVWEQHTIVISTPLPEEDL